MMALEDGRAVRRFRNLLLLWLALVAGQIVLHLLDLWLRATGVTTDAGPLHEVASWLYVAPFVLFAVNLTFPIIVLTYGSWHAEALHGDPTMGPVWRMVRLLCALGLAGMVVMAVLAWFIATHIGPVR